MSQPHGRGHISHTYDIREILRADRDDLTLTVAAAHSAAPLTVQLRPPAPSVAAAQIFDAVVTSLAISGNGGRWESYETLSKTVGYVNTLLRQLVAAGVSDLADPKVTRTTLRGVVEAFDGSQKRTLNLLLARALRASGHPNKRLPADLLNTKTQADDHRAERTYTDAEAQALEAAARAVYDHAFTGQRAVLKALGYDVGDRRRWLRIDAATILADAQQRDAARAAPLAGRPPPLLGADAIELGDWCLLNPQRCKDSAAIRRGLPATVLATADALYPPLEVLVAGLTLLCLADNSGLNVSVMLRAEASDVTLLGTVTGKVTNAKARNHSVTEDAATFDSIYSDGGVREVMAGLTRFQRRHRRIALAATHPDHPVIDRLFVRFIPDDSHAHILTHSEQANGARGSARFISAFEAKLPGVGP